MAFQDLLVWGSVLFAVVIVLFIGAMFIVQVTSLDIINQTFTSPDGSVSYNMSQWGLSWLNKFDWIFIFFFVMLTLGLFITGFMIPSHPIFLFIGVIGLIFWLFFSPMISNGFLVLIQQTPLSSLVGFFPMSTIFFLNLPLIGLVVGAISSIFLYGKNVNPYARQ